jgi:predicted aconitase
MTFEDDAQRDAFHKETSPTLQIIAQIFESECWLHGQEVVLIDILRSDRLLVGCPHMDPDRMQAVAEKISSQFKRRDKRSTCLVDDPDIGTFILLSDLPEDLSELG